MIRFSSQQGSFFQSTGFVFPVHRILLSSTQGSSSVLLFVSIYLLFKNQCASNNITLLDLHVLCNLFKATLIKSRSVGRNVNRQLPYCNLRIRSRWFHIKNRRAALFTKIYFRMFNSAILKGLSRGWPMPIYVDWCRFHVLCHGALPTYSSQASMWHPFSKITLNSKLFFF